MTGKRAPRARPGPTDPLGDRASEEQFVSRARTELAPLVAASPVRDYVLKCIELTGVGRTRKPLTAAEVADAAGVDLSHLTRALATDALPPAEEMITWLRLLRAAWFLALLPGRSGERVAMALHFSSGAQLGDTLQRMTKMRTMEVRTRGGFSSVMSLFRQRLTNVCSAQAVRPTP